MLDAAWDWYKKGDSEDADGFADLIKKKLTHGRAISLASKIMFLMNPWKVLPLDSRAKESLDYRGNKYSVFIQKAEQDKKKREKEIRDTLQSISDMLGVIESGFTGKIVN
ncbi:MAG: hypothetical protein IPM81_14300 [Saprospirales bacterium]|nr:hypothetical protein [Saprospirales bacterium]